MIKQTHKIDFFRFILVMLSGRNKRKIMIVAALHSRDGGIVESRQKKIKTQYQQDSNYRLSHKYLGMCFAHKDRSIHIERA